MSGRDLAIIQDLSHLWSVIERFNETVHDFITFYRRASLDCEVDSHVLIHKGIGLCF